MSIPCTDGSDLRAALAARDPETLVGPLLWLLTRLARRGESCACNCVPALVAHLTALAAHPGVGLELRLAAGGLAIEHRDRMMHETPVNSLAEC